MSDHKPTPFGTAEADKLLRAGWCQGSLFAPCEIVSHQEDIFWIVCTQSCNIVSDSLSRDPLIEVAEARPIKKFRERALEARGKNVRKLHLPVTGANFEALEVDVNSRRTFGRESLLSITPATIAISSDAKRNLPNWLARYYNRVALPNELVERLRQTVFPTLKAFMDEQNEVGIPRHEAIESAFISFDPDDELPQSHGYKVSLRFLCADGSDADHFDRDLIARFGGDRIEVDGINFDFSFVAVKETYVSDLDGWDRFSEWDHLSGIGEITV